QDLYFRLNGIAFVVPPLRERRGEIRPLAETFVTEASRQLGRDVPPVIAPDALAYMQSYEWPGNIRELRNVMERAVVLCQGPTITAADLAAPALRPAPPLAPPSPLARIAATISTEPAERAARAPLRDEIELVERQRIMEALESCAGNQTRAARKLGISRR